MQVPRIRTKLPGPKARRLIAQDERVTSPSFTRAYPLVVAKASGPVLEDVDGNRFLDFTAGIAVATTGHGHPRIRRAMHAQIERLIHMPGADFFHEPLAKLARVLARIAPGGSPKRVFFTNSGTESIEAALKLARYRKRRPRFLAFTGAFHGRSMGSLSLTGSKTIQRAGFAPLVPEVTHVPYAYCYRCPLKLSYPSCGVACVQYIRDVVLRKFVPPEEVAAIFVEPIQGEGGYVVPPPEFHPMVKKICQEYGFYFVSDEIQAGMGRTGKMFAIEHWGVEPDMITLAKGIASGLPLGALVAKSSVMTWPPASHSTTFGGNPVACEAALETIKLLEERLAANARKVGAYLLSGLDALKERYEMIGDVRGKGLMIGIEIVKSKKTRAVALKERAAILRGCFERGLVILGCGESSIRFSPPLVITRADADKALSIFEEVVKRLRVSS